MIQNVRGATNLDKVPTTGAAVEYLKLFRRLPRGTFKEQEKEYPEYGKVFEIFYLEFIENLRNPKDHPGRGPLITAEEFEKLKAAVQQEDASHFKVSGKELDGLFDLKVPEAREMVKKFFNKWAIVYANAGYEEKLSKRQKITEFFSKRLPGSNEEDSTEIKLLDKKLPKEFRDIIDGLKNNKSDYFLNTMISGFLETIWVTFEDLDTPTTLGDFPGSVEMVTKFRELMDTNGEEWVLFVKNLFNDPKSREALLSKTGSSDFEEAFETGVMNDRDIINRFDRKISAAKAAEKLAELTGQELGDIQKAIEIWAAWRLEGAGKTFIGTYFSHLEMYKTWAQVIEIGADKTTDEDKGKAVEEWAKARFRVIMGYKFYDKSFNRINALFGNFFSIPQEDKRIDELSKQKKNLEEEQNKVGENDREKWKRLKKEIDALSKEINAIDQPMRELRLQTGEGIANKSAFVHSPGDYFIAHPSKTGAWGGRLPYFNMPFNIKGSKEPIESDIANFIDVGHRQSFESIMFTPFVLRDFAENPNIAEITQAYYAYYENYTSTSRSLSIGHEVWDRDIRSMKDFIDSENDYGKKYARVSAFKAVNGFVAEQNSEDTTGGNRMLENGYEIRHTELVDLPQSVEKVHYLVHIAARFQQFFICNLYLVTNWKQSVFSRRYLVHFKIDMGNLFKCFFVASQ
jgi:hypothetical protein